jgi:hypothetical protein
MAAKSGHICRVWAGSAAVAKKVSGSCDNCVQALPLENSGVLRLETSQEKNKKDFRYRESNPLK